MNYQIDRKAQEPAYLQLYRLLVRDIVNGSFPFGTKLPSKRIISSETGVSVITVEHAYTILAEEGYIEARQRSGFFVTYRGEDFLHAGPVEEESEEQEKPNAQSTRTENEFRFPFSVVTKTMRRVLLDYGERILVKSPNHGCTELRGELSRYLARSRGITVKPSQIIIGSGAEYLYGLIVQLLGTDRIYAIEKPSYRKIAEVYRTMGATVDELTMGGNGIVSSELARTRAEILHVTPFNSFPSGVSADISKKMKYLRWAKERKGVLIEDNYDSELTVSKKPEEPLFSMADGADVIYLNTFSGTIAPSVRIGYMILPESLLTLFHEKLGFYSCTVPIFEQYVLAELIKNGDFERHINRVRREKRQRISEENILEKM